jgi:hypothetical protein
LPTNSSSYCVACLYIRPHTLTRLPTCVLILRRFPINVSSYYYCARLYMCPHTRLPIHSSSYCFACLYMCPHTTTALAYICVLILLLRSPIYVSSYYLCAHLYIYSALILPLARVSVLILPLARVHLPPRSGSTTTKTARKQLQQRIRRRMRWQA